jgi:hypothetical protein
LSHNNRREELFKFLLLNSPFSLLLRSVIFGLVGSTSHFFCLFTGNLCFLELNLFLGFSGSFLFRLNLGWVLLRLISSFSLARLDLGGTFGHGRLLLVTLVLLLFLILGNMGWVVSARVPIVGADLSHI